jgi:hypothetical protein
MRFFYLKQVVSKPDRHYLVEYEVVLRKKILMTIKFCYEVTDKDIEELGFLWC